MNIKNFFKEFKEFAIKGNVVDLAVAVVIGVAFNAIVDSFVKDVIMQLIAAIFHKPDFSSIVITYHDVVLVKIGNFLNQVINFVIVAFSVFIAVKFLHRITRKKNPENPAPTV